MIKPKKLHPGDKIATVSLSWGGVPLHFLIDIRQVCSN